ncbi:hypothetical protein [Pelosinus fermentans]|uniref:Uncharacterized protein n=1 Tax=Pelosinus fermentans JBW45 TaxID=1192197 RepID=I9NQY0_9FIRM|nr:hypothetical protein [Pelosinus fermentans]AJQ28199.1 hypothetical protein JBW_02855 [Pelosinus fermentans JBW45]
MNSKVFVEVTAKHDIYGNVRPLSIKWEDGRVFEVDRLLDVRQAASLKMKYALHKDGYFPILILNYLNNIHIGIPVIYRNIIKTITSSICGLLSCF